jgi:hypothetical protein
MSEPRSDLPIPGSDESHFEGALTAPSRPSDAQRRYLSRGLLQPGGKLPLFDHDGRQIDRKTIESCVERGWAEPWFANPLKANWLICRLTPSGYDSLGEKLIK